MSLDPNTKPTLVIYWFFCVNLRYPRETNIVNGIECLLLSKFRRRTAML